MVRSVERREGGLELGVMIAATVMVTQSASSQAMSERAETITDAEPCERRARGWGIIRSRRADSQNV